jgi:hypothetical protein
VKGGTIFSLGTRGRKNLLAEMDMGTAVRGKQPARVNFRVRRSFKFDLVFVNYYL